MMVNNNKHYRKLIRSKTKTMIYINSIITQIESISALFRTYFRTEYPFDPIELIVFSFIGASCGLFAAGYIKFHREIVHFFRRHEELNKFFQRKLVN